MADISLVSRARTRRKNRHLVLTNNKVLSEGVRLKQVLMAVITGILLLVTLSFLSLGVATNTETSSQTVDSGQVEDPRLEGTKSEILKVRIFSLGTCKTGDVVLQLCNKVVNCRSKHFYQEIIYSVCAVFFIILT